MTYESAVKAINARVNVAVIREIVKSNLKLFTTYNDKTKTDRRLKFVLMNVLSVSERKGKLEKITKELNEANAKFTKISWLEYTGSDGKTYSSALVVRVSLG